MLSLAERQDRFARALLDPELPVPAGVAGPAGTVRAERFAVYRNNVAVSLIKALAKRFPVTERLVGAEFFGGMARDYMRADLPASPLLFEYGDDFPDFIAAYEAAAGVPYLADVARLEIACTRAYHAEDAEAMTVAELSAIRPEDLAAKRLVGHPAAGLVRSDFPIGSIWSAHQHEVVEPPREWRAETVLVARPDMEVTVRADGRATHQSVISALDVLSKLGFTRIRFATTESTPPAK